MEGVFIFDDIVKLGANVIKDILRKVNIDDLTKALIREDEKIRKLFYANMDLDKLKKLDKKLKTTESFTMFDKKAAQKKILNIIAEIPEYKDTRFENGFSDIKEFEEKLLNRNYKKEQYGLFDKDITVNRFFESKDGDNVLADIKLKNEAENMGNIQIPNTNIQLINYSICPKCAHVFSFKEIADYFLNPRPDPKYNNKMHQFREDTRIFCNQCESYFLPALVIIDGTPKNEVQFLCRIQTMNAIEGFYAQKGVKVLSKRKENIVEREMLGEKKTIEVANTTFLDQLLNRAPAVTTKSVKTKSMITGIKNDVLLKEMESAPTLISNLIQYTPYSIMSNLIEGNNVRNGDLLFGQFN